MELSEFEQKVFDALPENFELESEEKLALKTGFDPNLLVQFLNSMWEKQTVGRYKQVMWHRINPDGTPFTKPKKKYVYQYVRKDRSQYLSKENMKVREYAQRIVDSLAKSQRQMTVKEVAETAKVTVFTVYNQTPKLVRRGLIVTSTAMKQTRRGMRSTIVLSKADSIR